MKDYVVGDLHGYFDTYHRLLRETGLIDEHDRWSGESHRLILVGDYFDRGTQGIECVELTMSLQEQARAAGGEVVALLGNHDMMILCAYRFGDDSRAGRQILDQWRTWGGVSTDLERLTDRHAEWLASLPAMAKFDDTLVLHADAMFYVDFGSTVDQVNEGFRQQLATDDPASWERTLRGFAEHRAFSALGLTGQHRADQILKLFGARRLIHGHTPIPLATGAPASSVTGAHEYAGGRCINVDAGMYLGSPGFVHEID